jgi:hypothetical protein
MASMSEAAFQKQVLDRLKHVENGINQIIEAALKEEKAGKLLTKKQMFG